MDKPISPHLAPQARPRYSKKRKWCRDEIGTPRWEFKLRDELGSLPSKEALADGRIATLPQCIYTMMFWEIDVQAL